MDNWYSLYRMALERQRDLRVEAEQWRRARRTGRNVRGKRRWYEAQRGRSIFARCRYLRIVRFLRAWREQGISGVLRRRAASCRSHPARIGNRSGATHDHR